jgi:hypothetical protein
MRRHPARVPVPAGPPTDTALGACRGKPGNRALMDEVSLELGQRGHDGEENLPSPVGA